MPGNFEKHPSSHAMNKQRSTQLLRKISELNANGRLLYLT
jgi:hypothetical protein